MMMLREARSSLSGSIDPSATPDLTSFLSQLPSTRRYQVNAIKKMLCIVNSALEMPMLVQDYINMHPRHMRPYWRWQEKKPQHRGIGIEALTQQYNNIHPERNVAQAADL
jgi:hypothetical protein